MIQLYNKVLLANALTNTEQQYLLIFVMLVQLFTDSSC